jgi:hypothetical protein
MNTTIRPKIPEIVWENILDDTYRCYVLAQSDTYGYLRMERLDTGERILDLEVSISRYFPQQDILSWGDTCMGMIDE